MWNSIKIKKFLDVLGDYLKYSFYLLPRRGIRNRYLPSIVNMIANSGDEIYRIVTGRKFQRIWEICKGGTLCKKQFGPVTILKSGGKNFGIVTGSKLAAKRPLKGGVSIPNSPVIR